MNISSPTNIKLIHKNPEKIDSAIYIQTNILQVRMDKEIPYVNTGDVLHNKLLIFFGKDEIFFPRVNNIIKSCKVNL